MRWKSKQHCAVRTIRRFLILPREIGAEVRWLEWAYITQRCELDIYSKLAWFDIGFADGYKPVKGPTICGFLLNRLGL